MSKQTLKSNTAIDPDTNCSICLNTLDKAEGDTSDLRCGHCFHTRCIVAWERRSKRDAIQRVCPNCRRPLVMLQPVREAEVSIANRVAVGQGPSSNASENRMVVRDPAGNEADSEDLSLIHI